VNDRAIIGEDSAPQLPRHVKLRRDTARDRWVLLAPERVLVADAIAVEILQRLDGQATVGAVADDLAEKYQSPRAEVLHDVIELLQDLADKGFLAA
jgi:pyrroloquinoline quinone biosynthesis protein D